MIARLAFTTCRLYSRLYNLGLENAKLMRVAGLAQSMDPHTHAHDPNHQNHQGDDLQMHAQSSAESNMSIGRGIGNAGDGELRDGQRGDGVQK